MFDKPAVVQLEPDFWAYAEQQSHESPTTMEVALEANAPPTATSRTLHLFTRPGIC